MPKKRFNVLIFPAGSEIGLEIYNSLKHNLHIELFGVSGKADHARFVYDKSHYEEGNFYITESDFVSKLNDVISKFNIDLIFPTHDSIVLFLAKNQHVLNARVVTSSAEVAEIAREKRKIYECFKSEWFCPTVYAEPFEDVTFPVFLKPNIGQGGKGTALANSLQELIAMTSNNPDLIPCELLTGEELSVDCFSDRHGNVRFVGPRVRHRVEMGISFNTFSVPLTEEITRIAEALNSRMRFRGAWFFQIKRDRRGVFKLLEFAPRQSSTMGLYRQAGVNFALLSIFDSADIDVEILKNDFRVELDRCLHNSYQTDLEYDCVYIDFDDTLVVNEKVNDMALRFLYQCKNRGIKVFLLTKHRFDIAATLDAFAISRGLFTDIIKINENDDKARWIAHPHSIFIDNYFFDRKLVKEELGIPVFDVDAIECLLV